MASPTGRWLSATAPLVSLVLSVVFSSDARATVTQVDGTIVPVTGGATCAGNMQICLNNEEGSATINSTLDASQLPEVFLPNTTGSVTFKDVAEGAGFENSFGYYNVGDDVTITANLHPILGCGVALAPPVNATHHSGAAGGYVVNAEPPNTATVNFATEATAGRYKGGFIGFYLITPEGNPSADNCGDYKNGTDGLSLFGRIYFTQRDLNNDGDFVHSLTYTSVAFPGRFYFGFEDLFRGGDNDFEDMLIAVTGLTPPCSPTPEVCDGLDNDCDGLVDAADGSLSGVGGACLCDGSGGLTCQGGNRQGVCVTGVTVCAAGGAVQCQSTVSPGPELCNTLDDNCNGTTDDGTVGSGMPCDGTDGDSCPEGVTVCTAGIMTCNDATGSTTETCNGFDDDCDGAADEDVPGLGLPCDGADGDLCQEGVTTCTGGAPGCTDATGTIQEVCNGVDDDCDGSTDESPVDVGVPCTVGVGECSRSGATICSSGAQVCNVAPGSPTAERCDGLDNDCDGTVDEGFNVGAMCDGVGACGIGAIECATLTSTRCSTDPGGSMSGATPETCNSIDDDCDGAIDEGLNDMGPCGSDVGECAEGRIRCLAGAPVCVGSIAPTPEVCDALDDDCDGLIDERTGDPGDVAGGLVDEGGACGDDTGECELGAEVCSSGMLVCTGEVGPSAEVCDGLDNDCDAITDNAPIDAGMTCGTTDVGECALGATICTAGMLVCSGEIGPTAEICNALDDDCNGTADDAPLGVGGPCGSGIGVCAPGTNQCVAGALTCVGATGGTTETCNGVDDDCDGTIDEAPVPGTGDVCGESIGECEPGTTFCISGAIQCVGGVTPATEICNGLDDNCDGNVDEGDLCADAVCINGECAAPCMPGEFSCPPGQACIDGFCLPDPCFNVVCTPDAMGNPMVCADGVCVAICDTVTCFAPDVCRPSDGLCVPDNCLFIPEKCTEDQFCQAGECVADPCHGVTCDAEDFCRAGDCVASCADVDCPPAQRCHDGLCQPTGCMAECAAGEVCRASDGMCIADPCADITCQLGRVCDHQSGECVVDPCAGIDCPAQQVCDFGDCFSDEPPPAPDAGIHYVYGTGSGGCSAGGGGGGGIGGVLVLVLVLVLVRGFGTRAGSKVPPPPPRGWGGLYHVALTILLASCDVDPFALRDPSTVIDAGTNGDAADGAVGPDARPDASGGCTAEVCDEIDNDCDGFTDEGFDLTQDELNCGACGVTCAKEGARTECVASACVIHECFPGFVDLNGDIDAPFDTSNGCEYACFTSNAGVEACDGLDNDCDGDIDEDTDFAGDETNCGTCGTVCGFFQANVTCMAGVCQFDPATDCNPGYVDLDGSQATGCEYACTPSGPEVCDFIDNDCDGAIDESFDTSMDPLDCGVCGRVCSFPHATPSCLMGVCGFAPPDCDPGFHDINGVQLDGCEYPCLPTVDPTELCDGLDNDCDGTVDGTTTDEGAACNRAPGGVATGVCTDTGVMTCIGGSLSCVGAPAPSSERCDGLDNDCDGATDESPVDVGSVCLAPVGACSAGIRACVGGTILCEQAIGPTPETCNGLDDDCDGSTDESPTDPGLGLPCGSDVGACTAGIATCAGGSIVCAGETPPASETCNLVDDDCDGAIDNSPIDAGDSCGSDIGACVPGTVECMAGGLVCTGGVGSTGEACNNLDDDCDGVTDESLTSSCYSGPPGTSGVGVCAGGVSTCTAGTFGACSGEVVPTGESCDNQDDDCDGFVDDGVSQSCYTGAAGTAGVGQCRTGLQQCTAGAFTGPCVGQVTPVAETCDNADDDCDGATDEAAGGGPLTQTCYTGPAGTAGVGTCLSGTQTCAFGAFGVCTGQVTPVADRCGDALDTDCDALNDAGEGCLSLSGSELRLDSTAVGGATEGSAAGAFHSYDVAIAAGGNPLGSNVYAAWVDKRNGNADVFFSRSTDGGATWSTITNFCSGTANQCVAPRVVAAFDAALGADRVYVAYQRFGVGAAGVRAIELDRSANSGASFSAEQRIDTGAEDNFHHDLAVNADGTRVVIAWEELNTATLARRVLSRASTNSGATMAAQRVVNVGSGPSPIAGRPVAAVTTSGRFVFVWRERRATVTQNVYANFSDDTTTALALANERRLDGDVADNRDADRPQIARVGQSLYAVWEDISTLSGGGSDAMFSRSTDNGATWAGETILDDAGGEVSSSFAPVIAVDGKTASTTDDAVYVAWEDSRDGSQVYASRSLDSGATWLAPVRASSDAGAAVAGTTDEVQIAFLGTGSVAVSYQNDAGAGGVPHVYVAASVDEGATWQIDDPRLDAGAGPATAPRLAPARGTLTAGAAIIWTDFRTGTGINGDPYRQRFGR